MSRETKNLRTLKTAAGLLILLGLGLYLMPTSEEIPASERDPLFVLAQDDIKFAPVGSEKLVFPKDHGIHHQSGSEIWQLIGYLETIHGGRFGFEVALLRVDLVTDLSRRRSAWATDQIFHLSYAITPFGHGEIYRNRETSRKAMGLAGYDEKQQKIWVYRRELRFHEQHPDLAALEMNIPDSAYPLKLELHAEKPAVIAPISVSFRYYTISRLAAKGILKIADENHAVTGEALFEHSWGKLPVGRGQLVRNRFLLQLSNRTELNLLQSRRRDGSGKAINGGFMILPDAKAVVLEPEDLEIDPSGHWKSDATGIRYPVQWRIRIPGQAIDLDLDPWLENQETSDFLSGWAGMVSVSGRSGTTPIKGFGHVQLSGYSPRH